jgi:hypothetical protein
MTLDNYISLISAGIAFVGLWLLMRQTAMESIVKIHGGNRELLLHGFDHPQLFAILADDENADPVLERRYLQLWFNHFPLINTFLNQSFLRGELKRTLVNDLVDFMTLENARRYWVKYGRFYPDSFQALVRKIVKKEPPPGGGGSNDT